MTPFQWSLTFGGACLVAAAVISAVCLRMFAREQAEDAAYAKVREEAMPYDGTDFETWFDSGDSPIYDALAAEAVIASAGEVVAAEWKRAEVFDVVDDWPGAS